MKKLFMTGLLVTITSFLWAQKIETIINAKEAARIEQTLAGDEMRGRKTFSPEIDKAAGFIATEFKAAGLQPWGKSKSYQQAFSLVSARQTSVSGVFDGKNIDPKNIIVITCQPDWKIDQSTGYETITIAAGSNMGQQARAAMGSQKNLLVWVDTGFAQNFPRLATLKRNMFQSDKNVVFILGNTRPVQFTLAAKHEITIQKLANVVGVLPGKSKKNEYVIFSGHYDHLGVGKPVDGDSIYNGANDDAAGVTAVIMLAKYFKKLGKNERTIIFAAFTAEEIGGYGSQYFSKQFDAAKVAAMFNIEMIGTESKWGKNSAYITGYEKTDMGPILQKSLAGSGFTFYPDPYPAEQLFYRSDNATLARLGVPAHTISTAKMDNEPYYHKVSDEVGTLDMENLAQIARAIAISSTSIISGKATPSRVKVEELR